jgi:hypothetical protein
MVLAWGVGGREVDVASRRRRTPSRRWRRDVMLLMPASGLPVSVMVLDVMRGSVGGGRRGGVLLMSASRLPVSVMVLDVMRGRVGMLTTCG